MARSARRTLLFVSITNRNAHRVTVPTVFVTPPTSTGDKPGDGKNRVCADEVRAILRAMEGLPPPGGGGGGDGSSGPVEEEVARNIEPLVVGEEADGNNTSLISRRAATASAAALPPPPLRRAPTLAEVEAAEAELDKQATAVMKWSPCLAIPGIVAALTRGEHILRVLVGKDDRGGDSGSSMTIVCACVDAGAIVLTVAVPFSAFLAAWSAVNNMKRRQIAYAELDARKAVADLAFAEHPAAAAARVAPPARRTSELKSPSSNDHVGVHHSAPVVGGVLPSVLSATQEDPMPLALMSETESRQRSSSSSSSTRGRCISDGGSSSRNRSSNFEYSRRSGACS